MSYMDRDLNDNMAQSIFPLGGFHMESFVPMILRHQDRPLVPFELHGQNQPAETKDGRVGNKNLLYSTGNSTQYSVMTYMGVE